jgi:hypothetical protein
MRPVVWPVRPPPRGRRREPAVPVEGHRADRPVAVATQATEPSPTLALDDQLVLPDELEAARGGQALRSDTAEDPLAPVLEHEASDDDGVADAAHRGDGPHGPVVAAHDGGIHLNRARFGEH